MVHLFQCPPRVYVPGQSYFNVHQESTYLASLISMSTKSLRTWPVLFQCPPRVYVPGQSYFNVHQESTYLASLEEEFSAAKLHAGRWVCGIGRSEHQVHDDRTQLARLVNAGHRCEPRAAMDTLTKDATFKSPLPGYFSLRQINHYTSEFVGN